MKIENLSFPNASGDSLSARMHLPLDEVPRFYAVFAHCFTCSKNFKAVSNISDTLSQLGVAVIFAAAKLDSIEAVVTIGAPSQTQHVKHLFTQDLHRIEKEGKAEVFIGGRPFTLSREFVQDLESQNLPELIRGMRKAFLFMHSPQDTVVGISNAAELYQAARHPKSFLSLDGADHLLTSEKESRYAGELISTWSKKYLPEEVAENDVKGHQVKVRLAGDSYTSEVLTPFHHLVADEPVSVGGDNLGPTPYDLLMASLGTCTAITLKMYANRKGWDLKEINVFLNHEKVHQQDSNVVENSSKGKITKFTRFLEIKGEVTEEIKIKLLEIANKCPVHKTLRDPIQVETLFRKLD